MSGFEDCAGFELRRAQLVQATIEGEIIPRLMLAHGGAGSGGSAGRDRHHLGPDEVAEFTRLVMETDAPAALAYTASMRQRGASLESIYLELLAPAARRLGEFWVSDRAGFAEVTIGLWRIQQVLHDLSPDFMESGAESTVGHRILLIPAPGEQHTLGLHMVADYFRRAGWDVCCERGISNTEMVDILRSQWFDLTGLSVSVHSRLETLTDGIRTLRRASRNPGIGILVGGPPFTAEPELARQVGADATAGDAPGAVAVAERLVSSSDRGAAQIS